MRLAFVLRARARGTHPVMRPPFQPEPVPVTLSDVYPFDFGKRTADLGLWHALQARAGGGPTCEVGVGDGRASADLAGPRYGIDIDFVFVRRAREWGVTAILGDASQASAWAEVPPCALVFCAYSTLFLLSHEKQEAALALMVEKVRPGGIVAVETFNPVSVAESTTSVQNPNSPLEPTWTRSTSYEVVSTGEGRGVTKARRLYGPTPGDWRMELDEAIYWRTPANLARALNAAGAVGSVRQETGPPVPHGFTLTTWTRPL